MSHRARVARDELLYVSPNWVSWYGIVTIVVTLVLQFWAALWPPGGGVDVVSFFQIYLGGIVLIVSYLVHKVYDYWYNGVPLTKVWLNVDEINVDMGRRQVDLEAVKQEIAEQRNVLENKPWWFKVYNFFC